MKKLLLASVSVMAFVSAAANANAQPEKINLQSLINTAMTSVNEETQVQLHKNLLAMTKGEERVNVSEAE